MRIIVAVVLVLSGSYGMDQAAQAQQLGTCKDCRDYHQVCVKAHSQAACKSELEICIKHCGKK
jgi:hypothetical protein